MVRFPNLFHYPELILAASGKTIDSDLECNLKASTTTLRC